MMLWLAPVVAAAFLTGGTTLPTTTQPSKTPSATPADTKKPTDDPKKNPAKEPVILEGTFKRLDGTEEDLSKYKGKVVIIVNVASKCGYTSQYAAMEALYQKHKDDGLVILGFPANNFGSQEPGTNEDIAEFCSSKYSVTFPMFQKISVKGADQHELYKKLSGLPAPLGGDPKWNFTKFLLDKDGKVVGRYDAKGDKTDDGKPDRSKLEPDLVKKVTELLGIEAKKPAPTPSPTAGS